MDLIESNFTRWANYCVGIVVLAVLFTAISIALRFIFR
jgi:hypothetical protein